MEREKGKKRGGKKGSGAYPFQFIPLIRGGRKISGRNPPSVKGEKKKRGRSRMVI